MTDDNRQGVLMTIVAGAIVMALVGGGVAYWQYREARVHRERAIAAQHAAVEQRLLAEAAHVEAREQAAIAEAVVKFQTEMLAAADPTAGENDEVTVLQTLQAAGAKLDEGSLAGSPHAEADVRLTLAASLSRLDRHADAEPHLRRALAIRRSTLPNGHPDIVSTLERLVQLHEATGDTTAAAATRAELEAERTAGGGGK